MGHINVKIPDDATDEFKDLLASNIRRLLNLKIGQVSLDSINQKGEFSDAITTIRVSINTRNKLKKYLKSHESYEEMIIRLIEENELLHEKLKYLEVIEKENHIIKYVQMQFYRERKTLMFHPDVKIEYSYNDSKLKSDNNFSFKLNIENYILQGKPIPEDKGIKTIQTINIIKSLSKMDLNSDPTEIIRKKENMLEDKGEYINTKYLIYFKILFYIINKKLDKKLNDSNLLNKDFWKMLYDTKNISANSLEEDVIQKLKRWELELEQLNIDKDRNLFRINLK
jgi:hypothetical protein